MSDKFAILEDTESPSGYPDVPPPYVYSPQSQKPRVVTVQPGPTPTTGPLYVRPSDNFFILSILMTVLCVICGSPCALCCTIPAIVLSVQARDAESRSDHITMKRNRTAALVLNIVGFVIGLILTILCWIWLYRNYVSFHHDEDGHDGDNDHHYDN